MSKKRSPKSGRPSNKAMPPRIDAAPDEIAQIVLGVKPPEKWRYLEEADGGNHSEKEDA